MRLSIWVLVFAVLIFVMSLGFLYIRTRSYIRQDAIQRATQVLNNTVLGVTDILDEVEIATTNTDWLVRMHLHPDSIYVYATRLVEQNKNFYGTSIAFEPYFFPSEGEYFSVYAYREGDSILVEQEGSEDYRYFERDWYRLPMLAGQACWSDPYYDAYIDSLPVSEPIVSYCKPLLDKSGTNIGTISTDLSVKDLSRAVMAKKPSEKSYCVMIDKRGRFLVHPDSTKLVSRNVFTAEDSLSNVDIITVIHNMQMGNEGMHKARLNGEDCYVFYRQVPRTGWSMAVVYPEKEIFFGYNRLFYIVITVIVIGLLLMLVFCRHIVNAAVVPINQLARQALHIAEGNFDQRMPLSPRIDAVGKLQNSFRRMQQSIDGYVTEIKDMNAEIEQRNAELLKAKQLADEARHKKTAFMQDITHQVRTPLNIITGFAQVLREGAEFVSEEEMATIIDAMQENSNNITNIVDMLIAASHMENSDKYESYEDFPCNQLCEELIEQVKLKNPGAVTLHLQTDTPDSLVIRSNRYAVFKVLQELLNNANKFTKQGTITLHSKEDGDNVQFSVTDTGIGIAEADRERVFEQFTKLDDFTEGIGLGLTLCRRSAAVLGGDLLLDPAYTGGARFVLTLPKMHL